MKVSIMSKVKYLIVSLALILMLGVASANSCSMSGPTEAHPGDEVYISLSFSGSNTVAVGVIYAYNNAIKSTVPGNASPWPNCEIDASQGQIGVGDYDGYDSGIWNYILNGTTTVMSFKIKISDSAQPGDVAKFRLKTVYYATTSNNMDQVLNQNLPTVAGGIFNINIVADEKTPTNTPIPTEKPEVTSKPTEEVKVPTAVVNPGTPTPIPTATPTVKPSDKATPTPTRTPEEEEFIDKTPIIPDEIVSSIDSDYIDAATGGVTIAGTRDDLGHTYLYEVAKDETGKLRYYRVTSYEDGRLEYIELSEEQFALEYSDMKNYLADKDNKEEYYETPSDLDSVVPEKGGSDDATVSKAPESDSNITDKPAKPTPGSHSKPANVASSEKDNDSSVSIPVILGIVGGAIVTFLAIYFLFIKKFKESKHK